MANGLKNDNRIHAHSMARAALLCLRQGKRVVVTRMELHNDEEELIA